MRFALRISEGTTAVHITNDEESATELRRAWAEVVEASARTASIPVPKLIVVNSPFRELLQPLLDFVDQQAEENPDRIIAVVIPELVHPRWWEYLLHNYSAASLKAALLFLRDNRVVVISTPWTRAN